MNSRQVLRVAAELEERGSAYALVTVVRAVAPTSAYVGAQAIVEQDGTLHGWIGGGCAKSVVIRAAQEAMTAAAPRLVRISNDAAAAEPGTEVHAMPCASNGTIELFIQPSLTQQVLILGDTPAAREAWELAQRMGFDVTSDARGSPQYALVATQGEGDHAALEAALASSAGHVLVIASPRKAQSLTQAMRARGVSEKSLARVHAPAGPDIGAQTPAEIALAAVAGLVALRRARPRPGVPTQRDIEKAAIPAAAQDTAVYRNPVCGVAVDPVNAKHTIEYAGERFYFCCDCCVAEFEKEPGRYAAIQGRLDKLPEAAT
jgi:xanthine dehydrogenase accessory factor